MNQNKIRRIYHLFPLGSCGTGGFDRLLEWIAPAQELGCDTVLLGPIWKSVNHGYDTTDYACPDPRLGNSDELKRVLNAWHEAGFRVLLDGVFNHCGRELAQFRDLRERGRKSPFHDWFSHVDFSQKSPLGDPFTYEAWNGCFDLVKYNHANPELRQFLFGQVRNWAEEYGIDGLRLDAADVIDKGFLHELADFCHSLKNDFWLLGEVIHGDYRQWTPASGLDSVTNYEVYKGLWSSLNDKNLFEIAWSLNRQYGPEGIYRQLQLCNFADNHDVTRVSSILKDPAYL
ncbi:MAG TPA: alpha-amylase family glycosyl hydrolase, partial [Fibrobacteraceae bacterium]|nr:alpha-amylase family glycosyl hydrolase [Fibrobacteraceae bacterium]